MSWRKQLGAAGEAAVRKELEERGWKVQDLDSLRRNFPNADLVAEKRSKKIHLQVKTHNSYGWIIGGSVNPDVCAGAPIFNRVQHAPVKCDFVVFLSPASRAEKKEVPSEFRHFVVPVGHAERSIRKNIDGYFNQPKKDGTSRKKQGTCGAFVGPGPLTVKTIPEQREDFLPYEDRYDLLDS